MKNIYIMVYSFLCFIIFCSAYNFPVETVEKEERIPVTADLLPILTNFTPIDSSEIIGFWQPSPYIQGLNISQLDDGVISIATVLQGRNLGRGMCTFYEMDHLYMTGNYRFTELKPDTIYQGCFYSKWYPRHVPADCTGNYGIHHFEYRLVRTYAEGK
mgnify:FL=1